MVLSYEFVKGNGLVMSWQCYRYFAAMLALVAVCSRIPKTELAHFYDFFYHYDIVYVKG